MPEGPEVRIQAEQLDQILRGKYLLGIEIDSACRYSPDGIPGYNRLEQYLPAQIQRVYPVGKKIIFELTDELYMISSLGMEGHWLAPTPMQKSSRWHLLPSLQPTPPNSPVRSPDEIPEDRPERRRHMNLWLIWGSYDHPVRVREGIVWFEDQRHFGTLEFALNKKQLDARLSDIGPDLLNNPPTPQVFKDRLLTSPTKEIVQVLMDQSYVSGIGNYLKSEILYRSGISPKRLVNTLSLEEFERLYRVAVETIKNAYDSKGHTRASYRDIYGMTGTFTCLVYNQKRDPEGREILIEKCKDQRTTYWVPEIQK